MQYRSFNRDIESSFTEYELEKKPCAEVVRFDVAQEEGGASVGACGAAGGGGDLLDDKNAGRLNNLASEQSVLAMQQIAEKVGAGVSEFRWIDRREWMSKESKWVGGGRRAWVGEDELGMAKTRVL